ncbi:MAG: prenyltransferase [Rhodospirillales bacterium]|nr:prenyltransferase [Rhodospirillales bacterium]
MKRLFLATRAMFLPASVLPVLLGTTWGYRVGGQLDLAAFILALGAVVSLHAGANIINDVCDDQGGTDRINRGRISPYTGGSRVIQNGIMTSGQMLVWGVVLLALAVSLGLALFAAKGLGVLVFGALGLALGILYSVPPIQLSAHGLGEAAVGLAFGVLPVIGAAWLQSDALDLGSLLLSLPVGLWVANILLVNEVPDIDADAATGKRTLAVILGPAGTSRLYLISNGLAVVLVVTLAAAGLLPPAGVIGPLLLGVTALPAARHLNQAGDRRRALTRAIKLTLAIHAAGTLWLAGLVWIG